MTAPQELLAKSVRDGRRLTLERHLLDTEQAAARLFSLDRRWGRAFCRFFGIVEGERERFLLHLRIAALFHDLGKANADFHDAVTSPGSLVQALRHEHLSALVLHLPEVRAWLAGNKALDLEVITAAVLSHHLKASEAGDWKWGATRGAGTMALFLDHPEVTRILLHIGELAGVRGVPSLPRGRWSPAPPWEPAWKHGRQSATRFAGEVRKGGPRRALLLATKAGVIVADSVASGLFREVRDIDTWIDEVAHAVGLGPDDLDEAILKRRGQQIEATRKIPFAYKPFQRGAAKLGPRALLLAPCGSGKTLAAWKWAEAQARSREIGKVVFLYPTRGTATEGFRDYVSWAPEADAALVHGTARYELEAMAENPRDTEEKKHFGLGEAEARLFALGLWSRRYFSATVDQFLGFMEHGYTGLCLLPVLADSAVIIDEVHSFDRHMFEVLIAFLGAFDVPVLCMTASLPASRREQLERAGLQVYPSADSGPEIREQLENEEGHPRYRIERVASAEDAYAEAVKAYRAGLRVLWVVNQVSRCQAMARRLHDELGAGVRCYHSRFLLQDRRTAHGATVADFQQRERAAIAVTTQVCEMSLDLDADVLITEIAPPTSLVQRFGRANRHRARGDEFRARLLTYPPERDLPYRREDVRAGEAFLAELGRGDVSQRDLAAALERHGLAEPSPDGSARFLEAGYYATPGELRDTDEFARACILDRDLEAVKGALGSRQPIDGWIVNVPRRAALDDETRPPFLPRYLGVAPGDRYDAFLGFIFDGGQPS